MTETDKDMRVSAELPGLEEKDVEVLMEDGGLIFRGTEKCRIVSDVGGLC